MPFTFEDYLNRKISAPVGEWYDPNGNSPRAVVTRMRCDGYFAALKWEVKAVAGDVKYFFTKDFKGIETPVAWFAELVLLPFLVLIVPFTRVRSRYRTALDEYRQSYEVELKRASK